MVNHRILSLAFLAFLLLPYTIAGNSVLAWMCLEICQETPAQISANIQQIRDHSDIIGAVSYEKFTLGSGGQFVDFSSTYNLTDVSDLLPKTVKRSPMLSSYPHPPEFLDYMRTLFADPFPFIRDAIAYSRTFNYSGYNVDFEPTGNATAADALNYVLFLGNFSRQMHLVGKELTADIASWSAIWDFDLLAANSGVDRLITMDTYASSLATFTTALNKAVKSIPLPRLGIGLDTENNYTSTDLTSRFALIKQADIEEVDLWKLPVPDNLWPFLKTFVGNS